MSLTPFLSAVQPRKYSWVLKLINLPDFPSDSALEVILSGRGASAAACSITPGVRQRSQIPAALCLTAALWYFRIFSSSTSPREANFMAQHISTVQIIVFPFWILSLNFPLTLTPLVTCMIKLSEWAWKSMRSSKTLVLESVSLQTTFDLENIFSE